MIKGLYIHIPFCSQICSYCDFAKEVAKQEKQHEYMNILTKELIHYQAHYKNLETIYIGGGTPTSLDISLLDDFLKKINEVVTMSNIIEFTIESNPNDISEELVRVLKKNNVSRISIGVQTVNESLLNILNRNHTLEDVHQAVRLLRDFGFTNVNLDFIYGIPNQTEEMLKNDLDFIKKELPEHVSYYSLILEEKTVLDYQISKGLIKPLDEDLVADYSCLVKEELKNLGYTHYETSNYELGGHESFHNLIYWDLEEYLGIGLNSASQYHNERYKNQTSISKYLRDYKQRFQEDFNPKLEYILMGLRKTEGIDMVKFKHRFNIDVFEQYPILKKHISNNLLHIHDSYLSFTELGEDLANQVYIDLI